MDHNQLDIARQVLQSYTKCVGRQEASAGHPACKQKPRHIFRNMTNKSQTPSDRKAKLTSPLWVFSRVPLVPVSPSCHVPSDRQRPCRPLPWGSPSACRSCPTATGIRCLWRCPLSPSPASALSSIPKTIDLSSQRLGTNCNHKCQTF